MPPKSARFDAIYLRNQQKLWLSGKKQTGVASVLGAAPVCGGCVSVWETVYANFDQSTLRMSPDERNSVWNPRAAWRVWGV